MASDPVEPLQILARIRFVGKGTKESVVWGCAGNEHPVKTINTKLMGTPGSSRIACYEGQFFG